MRALLTEGGVLRWGRSTDRGGQVTDSRGRTGVGMARAAEIVDYRWQVVVGRCGEVELCRRKAVFEVAMMQCVGEKGNNMAVEHSVLWA